MNYNLGLSQEKKKVDALFVLKRTEEYQLKKKSLYKCFVDQEKAFNKVPKVVKGQ